MSASPASTSNQPRRAQQRAARRRARARNHLFSKTHVAARHEEVAFWTQLEEREEGRLAQEADHLFDTSFAWTA
jgi:hypothetical protein